MVSRRFKTRPGLTGWSQIQSTYRTTWNKKIKFDIWYVRNKSMFLDLKIIIKTFKKIFISGLKMKKEIQIEKFTGFN